VEKPVATVVTPIDYDHMEFLGNTLTSIATEKAGIMKRGAPCFVAMQKPEAREVLKRAAREKDCPIHLYERDWRFDVTTSGMKVMHGADAWKLPKPALIGSHQYQNAALASVVAHALGIADAALVKGVAGAQWPARLQRLAHGPLVEAWGARGEVLLDGGHNPSAAVALNEWIAAQPAPTTLLLGMMRRKDAMAFLNLLKGNLAGVMTTAIPGNESYSATELAHIAREAGVAQVQILNSLTDVMQMEGPATGNLLIAGSLFLAGEVLKNHG
jgi:dihydrofolate synthase/folylpolyglutamate synthase